MLSSVKATQVSMQQAGLTGTVNEAAAGTAESSAGPSSEFVRDIGDLPVQVLEISEDEHEQFKKALSGGLDGPGVTPGSSPA